MANRTTHIDLQLPKEKKTPILDPGLMSTYAELQMPRDLDSTVEPSPTGSRRIGWFYIALFLGVITLILFAALIPHLQGTRSSSGNDQDSYKKMYLNISSELSKLRETLCGPANANNTEQLQCKYCPRNWVLHQRKCYSFSEEKRSWNDSAEYCKLQMARLAVFSSEEKNIVIMKLKIKSDYHWLGLSKEKGRWLWMTGEEFPTENKILSMRKVLQQQLPNGMTKKDTLLQLQKHHIEGSKSSNLGCGMLTEKGFQAEVCTNINKYICEKNATEFPAMSEQPQE